MKPGITIMPVASITWAPSTARPGRTSTITSPSMRTSALAKSPTFGSRLSTVPPWISVLPVGATSKSGCATEDGGGDAGEGEGGADLCVPDRGSGHDEERGHRRQHTRQDQGPHPEPDGAHPIALRRSIIETRCAQLEARSRGVKPQI